jgi:hypothetical protein
MSRKKKHIQMTPDGAAEGYRIAMSDLFTAEASKAQHQTVIRMREMLEALASNGKGGVNIHIALQLLVQLNTWVVDTAISSIAESCGHEDCDAARREGLLRAICWWATHLVNDGNKVEYEPGATH